MRWTLVDGKLATENGELVEEGQTVEFKESLGMGGSLAGIQAMVAFANSDGGRVFFGIRDDATVKGVQVGPKTLEDLATEISRHTYPTLPPYIEQAEFDGKTVVIVDIPRDTPPVVGVYVYSSKPIPVDRPVDASTLQAYRRVGRTSPKVDFMWLRQEQRSDPRLRLVVHAQFAVVLSEVEPSGVVWVEEASGTAHNVTFRMEPPLYVCQNNFSDLPYPRGRQEKEQVPSFMPMFYSISYRSEYAGPFRFTAERVTKTPPPVVTLVARYFDDWGLMWEASRAVKVVVGGSKRAKLADRLMELRDGGQFRRRIVRFPAKAEYRSAS